MLKQWFVFHPLYQCCVLAVKDKKKTLPRSDTLHMQICWFSVVVSDLAWELWLKTACVYDINNRGNAVTLRNFRALGGSCSGWADLNNFWWGLKFILRGWRRSLQHQQGSAARPCVRKRLFSLHDTRLPVAACQAFPAFMYVGMVPRWVRPSKRLYV